MFDFLDLNDNGHVDPGEIIVGATIAGNIGYGAGLAESEQREQRRQAEYEAELARRQERIDELEEELAELRKGRSRSYEDDFDEDDADDYVIDDDFDGYVEAPGNSACGTPFKGKALMVNVADLPLIENQLVWKRALNRKRRPAITCWVDGDDPNGVHGVGVYVNGNRGGYLPKGAYKKVAFAFDDYGMAKIRDFRALKRTNEVGRCIGVDMVSLEFECEDEGDL